MSQDESASEACTSRQFSLRSLLWFVALTSLWCSQIAVVRELVLTNTHFLAASSVASVLVAWIVLSWFCFRQRLFIMFTFHCVLPAVIGLWTFWLLLDATAGSIRHSWGPFLGVVLLANLFLFPVAATTMAIRWAWPGTAKKRHDRRMPWWP